MTTDERARAAFETLLENIAARARAAPEPDREVVLNDARMTLRELALKHGLNEHQAGTWAAQVDQEVRFRLAHDPDAVIANDNRD